MGEEKTYLKYLAEGRIYFAKNGDGMPRKKYYQFERQEEGQCATNWWTHEQFGHNQGANDCMTELFNVKNVFSNPKPIELIRGLIKIGNVKENDIILDFFSGSATTAHAVMQLNAEDGGNRKFIMVQLPEPCDEKSEAYKAGYKNICEIGKERIRRAGSKIKAENPMTTENLDTGFRVLKLDTTNMADVYYSPLEITQDMLEKMENNIKPDRTDLDLLFSCMFEWGLSLSMPYTTEKIGNFTIHIVNDGDLIACFDKNISKNLVEILAEKMPLRAVFRDACFKTSSCKINYAEIFKLISPDTTIKII